MSTRALAADRLAWGCVAVGGVGLAAALAWFWGANPGHADRFLVLLGAVWAARELVPAYRAAPARPRPRVGGLLVLLAAVLAPLAWYLQARVGPRPILLWWHAACLAAAAAGLLLARDGWPRLRVLAFPFAFVFFALPIPGRVISPLQSGLQELTTSTSQAILTSLGVAVERSGYVLRLPGGDLGVAEACSGVRSVTAITAIAAFVAYLRSFGPGRGVALVALAIPVVAAVNVVRVVLSGLIQEFAGSEYVRGDWHEALGVAMVFVGLGLVLGLARWLGGEPPTPSPGDGPGDASRPVGRLIPSALVLGILASSVAMLTGSSDESRAAVSAPLADIPLVLGGWSGEEQEVPAFVTETLFNDTATTEIYTNNLGRKAHVWVIFWNRFTYSDPHDPDVCWPRRGFEIADRTKEAVGWNGKSLVATARDYRRGPDRERLVYWMQDGPEVVADPDAPPTDKALFQNRAGHGWLGRMLGLSDEDSYRPRLMVLIAIPQGGDAARTDARTLAGRLAAELYRVCPWAEPGAVRGDP